MSHFFRKPAGRHLILMPGTPQKLLLAQPTAADLHQRFPQKPLDAMVPARLSGLASRFPQLAGLYNLPESTMSWKTFWRAGMEMQGKDHAHAWVLPDRFKPALIPMLANIGERTGYRGRYRYSLLIDIRLPNPRKHPHPIDRYRALAWDIVDDLPPVTPLKLTSTQAQQTQVAEKFELPDERPLLLVCPGSLQVTGSAQKLQLDASAWQAGLERWIEQGWRPLVLASHHEKLEINTLLRGLAPERQAQVINLAGQITWEEAVDLAHLAQAAVALDNALALIALGAGLTVHLPVASRDAAQAVPWLSIPLGAQLCDWSGLDQKLDAALQLSHRS